MFGCYGGSMVTLPSGNEAVLLGCEDFNSNRWDNNNIHGYKGMTLIFKLFWQGEHLEWELLTQSLRYSRTEAVAMLIPDSMTDCTAKCRYTFFEKLHTYFQVKLSYSNLSKLFFSNF